MQYLRSLFSLLKGDGALKILNLSWNGIGNKESLALGEALKVNNMVVHLDIRSTTRSRMTDPRSTAGALKSVEDSES